MTSVIPPESTFLAAAEAWAAAGDDTVTNVSGMVGSMKRAQDIVKEAKVSGGSSVWGPKGYITDSVDIDVTYERYRAQLESLADAAKTELTGTSTGIREISAHYVRTEQINTEIAGKPL